MSLRRQRPEPFHLLLALLSLALWLGLSPAGHAASKPEQTAATKTEELEQLRSTIQALEKSLNEIRNDQDSLRAELRKTELDIGRLGPSLRNLDRQMRQLRKDLETLQVEEKQKEEAIYTNRRLLAAQLRSQYVMGGEERLKLLLNLNDPAAVGRSLVYYDYINRTRSQHINQLEDDLVELAVVRRDIENKTLKVKQLYAEQQNELETMRQYRNSRQQVLTKLNAEINSKQARLTRLQEDQKALENLVKSLRQAIAQAKRKEPPTTQFSKLKGQLAWPLPGTLKARFGQNRATANNLKWRGVLIEAEEGDPVQAIASGQVVFAEWLRGFGLLVIIDHGEGYMSLYGHNQSLYKEVGDKVVQGDIIAAAGNSGGGTETGLYFEIRQSGNPLNPALWCQREKSAKK